MHPVIDALHAESAQFTLHLAAWDLSFWSPATHQRSTEASTYDVWVGDNSIATDHAQLDVPATVMAR
jgi:beta-glucosidase